MGLAGAGSRRRRAWRRTLEQVDALRLLAVFMQHTDTKPRQQRLLCLPGGLTADGVCERPFLLLHDRGTHVRSRERVQPQQSRAASISKSGPQRRCGEERGRNASVT